MNDMTSNMVSYLFITVFMVIFSTFGLSDFKWSDSPDSLDILKFEHEINNKQSEDAHVALHELLKAKSFSTGRVGAAGKYSEEYDNFSIVMHDNNAVNILKTLVQNGTISAKAYGLIGLKIKTPKLINEYKLLIMKSKKKIKVHGGCTWETVKVSALLFQKNEINYDFLKKEITQRYQWLKQNNKLFRAIGH